MRVIPFIALLALLAPLASAMLDAPGVPAKVAVYGGSPSQCNAAGGDSAEAAAVFAEYDVVVLSAALADATRADYLDNQALLAALPTSVHTFGVVRVAGAEVSALTAAVEAWETLGVNGVVLTAAAPLDGVSRETLNTAIDIVHASALVCGVNATSPAVVSAGEGAELKLGADDWFFLSGFVVADGAVQEPDVWMQHGRDTVTLSHDYGFHVAVLATATPTPTASAPLGFCQRKLNFAYFVALLGGFEGFGWQDSGAGAANNLLPYRRRPLVEGLGERWDSDVFMDGATLKRRTDKGMVAVDTVEHEGTYVPLGADGHPVPESPCATNCSNHGACVNNACVCNVGYAGVDCGSHVHTPAMPARKCSGHGVYAHGVCTCEPGWSGLQCELASANTTAPVTNSTATAAEDEAEAEAKAAAEAEACEAAAEAEREAAEHEAEVRAECMATTCAAPCRNGGVCMAGVCICPPNFAGADCSSNKTCPGNCNGHGECFDGACYCHPGFVGEACAALQTCEADCSGNGMCVHGKCFCAPGFTGAACAEELQCPHHCSGHGECRYGKCFCYPGWVGEDCLSKCDRH